MKFKVKAQMWGNSLGMRIPKMIAEKLRWSDASQLELEIRGESLIVRRQRTHSYELDDLLRDITPQNSHAEIKTGERRGGESW